MANNLLTGPQQGQQQQPSPVRQHANSPIGHNQFNQHFQQPLVPQVNPLMAPPPQYPQIPSPYFHQYPSANSPSVDSNESLDMVAAMTMAKTWLRDKKNMIKREKKEKSKKRKERSERREKQTIGHALTRHLKR